MNKNTPTNKQCIETLKCLIPPINCIFKRKDSFIPDTKCADTGCCCNCNRDCIVDDNERFISFVRKTTYRKLMAQRNEK